MGEAPEFHRLEEHLCFALYSAVHAVSRAYTPLLDPIGLTYPQYVVMLVLWEKDNCAVRELGARLHLDSGTLTPLLKRMEAAGLVNRTRGVDDQRVVRITLTPIGKALYEQALHIPSQVACAMDGDLAELEILRNDVVRLRDKLRASLN